MSETTEAESAAAISDRLLSEPEKFDFRAHLRGASHATDTVPVLMDAAAGWELEKLQKKLSEAEGVVFYLKSDAHGITGGEGLEEAEAKVEALKEEEKALLLKVLESKHTFHLRGVPRKQLELIWKKCRRSFKAPARKNFPEGPEGEDAFELATFENQRDFTSAVDFETVAACIVRVEDVHGHVDEHAWTPAEAEELFGTVYASEWHRLIKKVNEVTNGQNMFNAAIERDADFLSQR